MISLGIMPFVNSTAALMIDETIVACACEDRFTRQKSVAAYPKHSIEFCLDYTGVKPKDIDFVMLPYKGIDLRNPTRWITDYDATFSMEEKIREQHEYFKPVLIEGQDVDFLEIFNAKIIPERLKIVREAEQKSMTFLDLLLHKHLDIEEKKICYVDHHKSHIMYAINTNRNLQNPSLIFCMEGYGGDRNGSISIYKDNKLEIIYQTPYCWIGRLYRYITLLLGMKTNEHEYKVMGLAPYSSEYTLEGPLEVFRQTAYVDGLEIKFKHKPKDMYFYFKENLEPFRFDGIAGALQRYTEEIICEWVGNAISYTGIRDVMFTGGVAMNIKAMMELSKIPKVNSLWVGGTSSDESLSMGAIMLGAYENEMPIRCVSSLYLGKEYSDQEIEQFINLENLENSYQLQKHVSPDEIAARLEDDQIVGRFCGREEFGARALGNRSILANPKSINVIRRINEKIKSRDFWMPFAPVILEERKECYLIDRKNIDSPYMTIGFESTDLAKDHLLGALHPYDFTARPQILRQEDNVPYYEIIKAFEQKTGIGGLLNTSLNLHGEPIVHSLKDALRVFEVTQLDCLQLGQWLISKQ